VSRRPLEGVTVLEVCHFLAGPYAGLVLADLGADVIKLEDPDRPDEARSMAPLNEAGESLYFLALNWGKRSVGVRLASEEGRAVAADLAARADVLLTNYRPGALARRGLDARALAARNPRLVTCAISGFGETGPDADRPGYDYTIQAMAGVMHHAGEPDGPPAKAGISYVDHSGGLAAALGVVAALFERERTGRGRHVDLGLFDVQVSMLSYLASWSLNAGLEPARTASSAHPSLVPAQNFETADGWISLFVGNDSMWARLVEALGDEGLADPRFATRDGRLTRRDDLVEHLGRRLREAPSRHWVELLSRAGVACAPVNTVAEALAEPQVAARGLVVGSEHPAYGPYRHVAGPLPGLGGCRLPGAPRLGEHTEAVLAGIGYDEGRIAALGAAGVLEAVPA